MAGTLTIPQQLIDDINAKLGKDYPSLEAVRVSRDRIEIREKVQDDIAAAFPVRVAPENVAVKATKTAPKKKPAQEAPKTQTEGFGIEPVTEFSGMLTQEQQMRLRIIIDAHQDILTRTKPDSGVWHKTCREIARLADGTFGSLHNWNAAWMSRLYSHGISTQFLSAFSDVPVLYALDQTLDYIQDRWKKGLAFWWPKDGVRRSLLEFLVSGSRDGSETSPFFEVFFWCMTWMGYREAMPPQAQELMDREARKTGYTGDALVALWSGAAQVVQWYENHREELMRNLSNRSRLANSWDLLRLICDWNAASKFTFHPLRWVRSRTENWNGFKAWAEKVHGVSI